MDNINRTEFTKEMKQDYTILVPDIFPMHMELIREVFRMYGFKVDILHYAGKPVIDQGLQHLHNDICYPLVCMTGQMIHALKCGDYDPHKVALLQFQTGGGCRASNYIWLMRKALHNMDMDYVPVLSLSFNGMEKNSGFRLTPMMLFKGVMAIVYGDLLMLLKNQVKPYELTKGTSDALVAKWIKYLADEFRHNRGLLGKAVSRNLHAIASDFRQVQRSAEKKVRVGIVGEIYVKYSPFGNNGLEAFLDTQDCEYMVPGVVGFIQYCFANTEMDYLLYGGKKRMLWRGKFMEKMTSKLEKYLLDTLKDFPEFTAPTHFDDTKKMADKVIGRGVKMGEGWLLPAEMGELIEAGYENIVCAQPFGCLPNHIVGKGVVRTLKEMYPNSNICPVDYDSGAVKVNQENRIKLMLAVAKERLENEEESNNQKG